MNAIELAILAGELPPAEREFRFHPPRRWRADYAWPECRLLVEVEGAVWTRGRHTRGSGYVKDLEKYNQMTLDGFRLLRVTPDMVKDGRAVALIQKALEESP